MAVNIWALFTKPGDIQHAFLLLEGLCLSVKFSRKSYWCQKNFQTFFPSFHQLSSGIILLFHVFHSLQQWCLCQPRWQHCRQHVICETSSLQGTCLDPDGIVSSDYLCTQDGPFLLDLLSLETQGLEASKQLCMEPTRFPPPLGHAQAAIQNGICSLGSSATDAKGEERWDAFSVCSLRDS